MPYNRDFNKCEMAKVLIETAKGYISTSNTKDYNDFIEEFDRPDWNYILTDVENVITERESFNVTIAGNTYNDILPYYVQVVHQDGYPAHGFYNFFKSQNYKVFRTIVPNNEPPTLTNVEKQKILEIAKDALTQHLNTHFNTQQDIDNFIEDMNC